MDVLGIDVSKGEFHACLLQRGKSLAKTFANDAKGYKQILTWLKKHGCGKVHSCMEATGAYWLGLACALYNGGLAVSVVNPSRIALFSRSQLRRTKTDRVDAAIIADFCATQRPVLWAPPAPETLELRGLLTYRDQLIGQRTAIRQIADQVQVGVDLRKIHKAQITALNVAVAAVEKSMKALLKKHSDLGERADRLKGIKGIGFLTAAAIVAKLPVERLHGAKAAAAYVGLTPRERQSGTSINGRPRICKTGNAELRRDLYMPALVAIRHNPLLKSFAERLGQRGKPPKVIIVAVMRKLITLAFRVLTERDFHPAGAA